MKMKTTRNFLLGTILALTTSVSLPTAVRAADHGDGPTASLDRACDIGDLYFFVDPTNPLKVVLIGTVQGFIVPSEASNFGVFDQNVRYRFAIENSGDAIFDKTIDVTFSPRATSTAGAKTQVARIAVSGINGVLTANATNPTVLSDTANPQVVTALSNLGVDVGIDFFAGEVDDPFFFDIVGFNRFVDKVVNGVQNPGIELNRGRDSFAGYNTLAIALRVPIALLKKAGSTSTSIGANFQTARRTIETPVLAGVTVARGPFRQVDRMAIPAVNVALVPFHRKNRYNAATPVDDKNLVFGVDILATLNALGTSGANVFPPTGNALILANAAVLNGDILRLNTTGTPGFPNGRRLQDDVVDIILGIIAGGTLSDNANANDINGGVFGAAFPYVLPPQQPFPNGTINDRTQN